MKQKKQPLFLEGVISVEAAMLARNREINCIYISKSRRKQNRDILNLQNLAKKLGIPVWKVNEDFINLQANGHTHGGVLASVGEKEKIDVRQLIKNGKFIVAIDGIEDPFNLGYSIRTLYAAGVDGVLLPNRSWSNADGIISRASAGSSEWMPVAFYSDELEVVDTLKNHGFTIVCAAKSSQSVNMYDASFAKPAFLIIGGEKRGISKVFLENADLIIEIPYARRFAYALPTVSASAVIAFEIMHHTMKD